MNVSKEEIHALAAGGHVGEEFMDRVIWEAHERRLTKLEDGYAAMAMSVSHIETKIEKNNELTSQIHSDTKDMREMLAGARVFGKFAAWVGVITGAIVSIYALVQLASK